VPIAKNLGDGCFNAIIYVSKWFYLENKTFSWLFGCSWSRARGQLRRGGVEMAEIAISKRTSRHSKDKYLKKWIFVLNKLAAVWSGKKFSAEWWLWRLRSCRFNRINVRYQCFLAASTHAERVALWQVTTYWGAKGRKCSNFWIRSLETTKMSMLLRRCCAFLCREVWGLCK